MAPLLHYLLIYDHSEQRLLDALELGTNVEDAARTYADYEQTYRDRQGIEIVLVGADSLDTIRRTHAHYFSESAGEPFEKLLAGT
jgi:hypothetical protein